LPFIQIQNSVAIGIARMLYRKNNKKNDTNYRNEVFNFSLTSIVGISSMFFLSKNMVEDVLTTSSSYIVNYGKAITYIKLHAYIQTYEYTNYTSIKIIQ